MSISAAMEEAYAAARPDQVIVQTLEMDHPAFAQPVRIVTNVAEDMTLTVPGAGDVLFQACGVSITLPGDTEDGPTQARVRVDNVSGILRGYLKDAVQAGEPIKVTFRAYILGEMQPGEVIDGMELASVSLTATAAEGALKFRELELQAFPLATYDQQYYPALQG
ncbi:DUF1833 family protein [Camelimonas lactis]|uniref:Uncharacterized protein DUF1833 n=1 Tax=Camelimonas lactis TaxID=659006 RepID=A0A4R2GXW3_9HYPH|nr:DUF1833 family protein [Camelimonas lactis]TCO15877.1 uncharacterized protein DUF1833 [Camelimonas lactis]